MKWVTQLEGYVKGYGHFNPPVNSLISQRPKIIYLVLYKSL